MAEDDKKLTSLTPHTELFAGKVVTFKTSAIIESTTSTSLTESFGPNIWKAPELPIERPPPEHPVYNLVGQIASDWSHVEHTLDTIIWALADVNPEAGACITSQMLGHYGRFKAIVALLTLHERNSQKKTAALTATANRLMGKANLPGDERNRNIHDPWYVFTGHGVPGQFKTMPKNDFKFGIHPSEREKLEKNLRDIHEFAAEVEIFRTDVIKMLNLTTLGGAKTD
jgi:hypothetical protein